MLERELAARKAQAMSAAVCIVMVCNDQDEADQISSLLAQHEAGCLVTYRKANDLMTSAPQGRVSLVILAGEESPAGVSKMLKWLKRRWPNCPVAVIGSPGDNSLELVARSGSASYLVRPVSLEEWSAVVAHAMRFAPVLHQKMKCRLV